MRHIFFQIQVEIEFEILTKGNSIQINPITSYWNLCNKSQFSVYVLHKPFWEVRKCSVDYILKWHCFRQQVISLQGGKCHSNFEAFNALFKMLQRINLKRPFRNFEEGRDDCFILFFLNYPFVLLGEEIWAGMDVVAERILLRYPVSVPLEEEVNQEEEVEGHVEEGNMRTTTTSTSTTTSQQHIEPHSEQQTSLPQTIQPPSGPPALHSTPSPRDRSHAPNSGDVIENADNDDVIHTNNNVPDHSNNQMHRERSIGSSSGSSSPSYNASRGQNVLLAEVVAYFITTLLMKIIMTS